jgi:hypothetical protein
MLRLGLVVLVIIACQSMVVACKSKEPPPAGSAGDPPAVVLDAAPVAAAPAPPPARPTLQIQLRSTPAGAEAQVDGKPATVFDLVDDGGEHEFVFLLPGYAMERYRTRPLKSGVIHARMRVAAAGDVPDAGP